MKTKDELEAENQQLREALYQFGDPDNWVEHLDGLMEWRGEENPQEIADLALHGGESVGDEEEDDESY